LTQTTPLSFDAAGDGSVNERPLVVDLDGTLVHTDTLHELAIRLLAQKPHLVLLMPIWLIKGKAYLKNQLAKHVELDVSTLPFNNLLIEWLREQKKIGRKLVLCTATHNSTAEKVAKHLHLFDHVIATEDQDNLSGSSKSKKLEELFGKKGFDYIGNSKVDLKVWANSKHGIVVNGSKKLSEKAQKLTHLEKVFPKEPLRIGLWSRALRLHQWIKNVLIFVPILAAHQEISLEILFKLLGAFIAFGLCASSVYIANDLLDLESDRQHPRKRTRPFASGAIEIWKGVLLVPVLILASALIAHKVGEGFLAWLMVYFALTCLYSWGLKRLVVVDCLTLAVLYTLRIVGGAAAVVVPLSFWLLAFSIFLFLSLAFIKRYAELQDHLERDVEKAHGRGYYTDDAPLVQQLGVSAGFSATLVLALYLNSENVLKLYRTPELIWVAVPLILLWVSWMWLKAHRGLMHDDPIVFAIKDRVSLGIGALFVLTFLLAR